MKNILRVPETGYNDFYDIARFKVTWQVNMFLSLTLFVLSVFFLFTNLVFFTQYFIGFVIVVSGLIYLRYTHNFKIVSFFVAFSALSLVLSSLFLVKNIPHLIEPLWLVAITVFAFYNLGVKWGAFILSLVITGLIVYQVFFMNNNFVATKAFSDIQILGVCLEMLLSMTVIGYFMAISIRTTEAVENRVKSANSELNEQNRMIALQNEEKTVLIQEIHHRVKNNLQVITSLLRLQSSEIESPEVRVQFTDAINRVMTMSMIHQKMYESENLSRIDLKDYFTTLINDLIRTSVVEGHIETKVDVQIDSIESSAIVPLALLISELVSNSAKHAFENGNGQIEVELFEKDGKIKLNYNDNGSWKEKNQKTGFGLELIDVLTEQLDGTLVKSTDSNGTSYAFCLLC